jgi:hypothetical protein
MGYVKATGETPTTRRDGIMKIRNHISMGLFAAVALLLGGCGSLDYSFDFTHASPDYEIAEGEHAKADGAVSAVGDVNVSTLEFAGGWTTFTFDVDIAELPATLKGLEVIQVRVIAENAITGEAIAPEFMQRLELYTLSEDTGMPSFMLAMLDENSRIDTEGAELHVLQAVNLTEYLEKGMTFYAFLQGQVPSDPIVFRTEVDFRAYTRGY